MLTPVFGCTIAFVLVCTTPVISSSTNVQPWSWATTANNHEIPIGNKDAESSSTGSQGNRRRNPKIAPVIKVHVFEPNTTQQMIHHSVQVHVVEDAGQKHKRSKFVPPSLDDNFISVSSSLMEINEFPIRLRKGPNGYTMDYSRHPNEQRPSAENLRNLSSDQRIKIKPIRKNKPDKDKKDRKKKNRRKNKKKRNQKATIYVRALDSPNRLNPGRDSLWISLRSPRRLRIPVWRDQNVSDPTKCFQCPSDITLTAEKGDSEVVLPIPPIAICHAEARRKGRLNLAVISGPTPGVVLREGVYPTELIGWKNPSRVYSCQYSVTVKVKKCQNIVPQNGVEVNCEHENVWGSACSFFCSSPDYVITGSNFAICMETATGMAWSNPSPTCGKKRNFNTVSPPTFKKLCKSPVEPSNGTIACNSVKQGGFYVADTICRYFCFPGFELRPDYDDSLIVCKKGVWTPNVNVSCSAVTCPHLKQPHNGRVKCQRPFKDPWGNGGVPQGTTCTYSCNPGFIVPMSQEELLHVKCIAPNWNQTSAPDCKQQVPPQPGPQQCTNITVYISRKNVANLTHPKFYATEENGEKRLIQNVTCTHKSGKLVVGKHINRCTAYDAELDVKGSCSYTVEVKEKSCPVPRKIPHSNVVCRKRKKPVDKDRYNPNTVCEISCVNGYSLPKPFGKRVFSRCLPNLKWNRSWRISCIRTKINTLCPSLPAVSNGQVKCRTNATENGHDISSVCSYVCENDHVVPSSQLESVTRHCLPTGKWNTTVLPTCVRATLPKPEDSSCKYIEKETDDLGSIQFSPTFIAANGSPIHSNCTPSSIDAYGLTNITCTALDSELRVENNCTFSVNVSAVADDGTTIATTTQTAQSQTVESTVATDWSTDTSTTTTTEQNDTTTMSASTTELSTIEDTTTEPSDSTDIITESPDSTTFTDASMVSETTTLTDDAPKVVDPGCFDQITESGFNFNVSYPEFITSRNTSAEVVCSPIDPDVYETQTVSCEAVDPETNASSSCEFKVTVADGNLRSHDIMEDITEALTRDIYSSISEGTLECTPLEAPSNGFINCSSPYECAVECDDRYRFPSGYPILQQGELTCDKFTGLWNFQTDGDSTIPDCLRELPTTSVEVWLGFSATVENCTIAEEESVEEKIKQKLLETNSETCELITCNATLILSCSDDDEGNSTLVLTWNLRASYDPKDYQFNKKVPVAETQLETVLETTKESVTSDDEFNADFEAIGLQLNRTSFGRGHMVLVCDEKGFVVDSETDTCVECPAGTMETGGSCTSCPPQHYQEKSGQTTCIPCPTEIGSDTEIPDGC